MNTLVVLLLTMLISMENVQPSPIRQMNHQKLLSGSSSQLPRQYPSTSGDSYHGSGKLPASSSESKMTAGSTTLWKQQRRHDQRQHEQRRRFRRSFGYRTQCMPVMKMKCKVFKIGNLKKTFCVEYLQLECVALD